jgi:hypothetical protein
VALKSIEDKGKEGAMGALALWFLVLTLGACGVALYSIKN